MKYLLIALLIATAVGAQMAEMLGGLAIQGALTTQGVKSAAQGMNELRKTQIIQEINQVVVEIQIGFFSGYQNVKKSSVSPNLLKGMDWDVWGDQKTFTLQMKEIEQGLCQRLMTSVSAQEIWINGQQIKNCDDQNTIKFIFK